MEQFLTNPNPKIKIIRKKKIEVVPPTLEYNASMSEYIDQLSETEKKAFDIAKEHLGTSFNPYLSNGYLKWIK